MCRYIVTDKELVLSTIMIGLSRGGYFVFKGGYHARVQKQKKKWFFKERQVPSGPC